MVDDNDGASFDRDRDTTPSNQTSGAFVWIRRDTSEVLGAVYP